MKMGGLVTAILAVMIFVFWLVNHSGFFPYTQNPMQYMPNMHRTKALIPQRGYSFYANGSSVRVPPVGTAALDIEPYRLPKSMPATEVPKSANPVPATKEVLLRGQKIFMTYCVVCHGPEGLGNGYIVPPFPQPPSLQSEKIRGFADSQIFHIISVGQNSMNAYGPWIREQDRWAIIHYIRALQLSQNPSDEDMKAFEGQMGRPVEQK